MSATGQQQQGGVLRSRRGLGRDKDPGPGLGMEAACWLAPGVLRRLIELPSPPLSRHQLKRLEEHRYSSAGRSLLEPLMQRYWEWLVGRVPAWIAPNLITIIGLATNVFTTLVLIYYCPTATEQSLDAIDGKQARRTNSSSPLGELFDHGCDSLSTVLPCRWAPTRTGCSSAVSPGCSCSTALTGKHTCRERCASAYLTQQRCRCVYQDYRCSQQLWVPVCGTPRIDVTEVQLFIIIMYLLAAVGGSAFWQSLIPILNIQMKMVPAICTFLGAIFSCTNYFRVIFTGGVGKNGSTIAGTSVLSPVLHIGSVIILAMMIYKKSAVQLFEKHPCLYILAFGCVSAKITNKLVVAHMTKSEMHLHDLAFLGPGLLFLDQYFNSFIDEYLVLWIALIISFFDLVRYCVSVCNQIACHLHIFVFKIAPCSVLSSAPH
ncbi:Choline/ethanolaminephosphotransferase 1 [Dissostichus eleginoides]|uniref:Choline/ethanolaminephosphotransferase 1 n=1 Tax=Dissostichus eleginoides TaxID=100907 RepID=A0AAD9FGK8_DISEL|nr:Choline/ethanolaminephosphotransferase 1 [Dissostichus eleginoides]